jgi:hypothetical protein
MINPDTPSANFGVGPTSAPDAARAAGDIGPGRTLAQGITQSQLTTLAQQSNNPQLALAAQQIMTQRVRNCVYNAYQVNFSRAGTFAVGTSVGWVQQILPQNPARKFLSLGPGYVGFTPATIDNGTFGAGWLPGFSIGANTYAGFYGTLFQPGNAQVQNLTGGSQIMPYTNQLYSPLGSVTNFDVPPTTPITVLAFISNVGPAVVSIPPFSMVIVEGF